MLVIVEFTLTKKSLTRIHQLDIDILPLTAWHRRCAVYELRNCKYIPLQKRTRFSCFIKINRKKKKPVSVVVAYDLNFWLNESRRQKMLKPNTNSQKTNEHVLSHS